jgi:predicted nucleic acid-binding protein
MKRDTRSAYRARTAQTERSIDAALAEVKAERDAKDAKNAEAYAERTRPVSFTREELQAARAVRTRYGWHRVVRVNTTTATVNGDFGDYRVPEKNILEVRS